MIEPQVRPAELGRRTGSVNGSVRGEWEPSGPRVILLFTRDRALDELVAQALLGSGAIVLIARDVSGALAIVCGRGRELDLAVLDFDGEGRGMTLLSAVHTCYSDLPILITTTRDEQRIRTLAYANGASACLNKLFPPGALGNTIAALSIPRHEPSRRLP